MQAQKSTNPRVYEMPESLTKEWVATNPLLLRAPAGSITLDFAKTRRIDSAGICMVHLLKRQGEARGHDLVLAHISEPILKTLSGWTPAPRPQPGDARGEHGFFTGLGSLAVALVGISAQALSMLTEMVYWGTIGLLKKRDFRKGVLGEQMYQLGYKALGIVGTLSLLIGMVLGLQTAMQLRMFGAGLFLAPMIGISMIRELGPLLTAIILAGRTGSATTAEIATMGVGEELDALRTMGINPIQFVVVPKFWAITFTMPLLSIVSTAAGIFGGLLVSIFYLDLSPNLFLTELVKNMFIKDFFAGFIRSVVFSWLIIWIGSFYGFKVRGGAEAVGRETTASVVTGISAIIVADAILSFII